MDRVWRGLKAAYGAVSPGVVRALYNSTGRDGIGTNDMGGNDCIGARAASPQVGAYCSLVSVLFFVDSFFSFFPLFARPKWRGPCIILSTPPLRTGECGVAIGDVEVDIDGGHSSDV